MKTNCTRKVTQIALLFMSLIWFTSCTATKSVISNSANIDKYKYATITNVMDYGGAAALMNLEIEIYDALASTRLNGIGDKQVESLSEMQKEELLLIRFSASQNEDESVVSINFTDYSTGIPIASCIGAFSLGLTKENDMRVATDRALEEMKKSFSKAN